jgi:hypothetical protein
MPFVSAYSDFDYASVKYRSWRWLRSIGISPIQSSIIVENQFDLLEDLQNEEEVLPEKFKLGICTMVQTAQLDHSDASLLRISMITYLVCHNFCCLLTSKLTGAHIHRTHVTLHSSDLMITHLPATMYWVVRKAWATKVGKVEASSQMVYNEVRRLKKV